MASTLYKKYLIERQEFLEEESKRYLGSHLILNETEVQVNKILMREKSKELEIGLCSPGKFIAAKHMFEVLETIKNSKVFQIIHKMPKGGALHGHDTALLSTDKILKFTYRDNLWTCGNLFDGVPHFIFAKEKPTPVNNIEWELVADARLKYGVQVYDKALRKLFTLYTEDAMTKYKDIDMIWAKFMDLFTALDPIVCFVDIWKDYYYEALKEFYQDGVLYLEFRGLLPELYDLDGNKYGPEQVVDLYYETLQRFKIDYPGFGGSKFIYAPLRFADDSTFDKYIEIYRALKQKYPDFIAGFDLVGQEDKGFPLKGFAEKLLSQCSDIPFIFHAGETNWNGLDTDENLIDAILLGTKRIGHGFAAVKHPKVLEEIKKRDISIEVNPLSNQVLKLVTDLRNHPASILFSDNYPVVVSSDDPSFWEALPLTHDFYFAFMGIASAHADLKFLKCLILNSLKYSSLTQQERTIVIKKWEKTWNSFLDQVIQNESRLTETTQM